MLKGIPQVLSPDLLKILMETGHGDEIVIADGNFPAASIAQRLIRLDGHQVPKVLDAILQFLPLDKDVEHPVTLMGVSDQFASKPEIWNKYESIVQKHNPTIKEFGYDDRFSFYDRAKKAYAVIATSERALFANVILKKGIVTD